MSVIWSEARLSDALRLSCGPSSDYDLNPKVAPPEGALRPAGVLAAFHADDGRLVLTKRGSGLRHHPGQIALPGGKVDPGDADAVATALREAQEEVALDPAQVRILGCLPPHRTVTGFSVTPVVALIDGPFQPRPEAGEVDEAFTLPFDHVADPDRYRIERRRWLGGWRSYHAAPFGPYYLWGATARILLGLARRLNA
ncbi:NUDIX hydrolase [Paracoccus sp. (in: a-proteobacteria)]|uniref:NUDIX hydrolase n=1 Tax=Paracoccus sp. TaxID=267 RepID=UPI00396CE21C